MLGEQSTASSLAVPRIATLAIIRQDDHEINYYTQQNNEKKKPAFRRFFVFPSAVPRPPRANANLNYHGLCGELLRAIAQKKINNYSQVHSLITLIIISIVRA